MRQRRKRRVRVQKEQTCPLCKEPLASESHGETLAVCADCETLYHDDCVLEMVGGACSTLGCKNSNLKASNTQVTKEEALAEDTQRSAEGTGVIGKILLNLVGAILLALFLLSGGLWMAVATKDVGNVRLAFRSPEHRASYMERASLERKKGMLIIGLISLCSLVGGLGCLAGPFAYRRLRRNGHGTNNPQRSP